MEDFVKIRPYSTFFDQEERFMGNVFFRDSASVMPKLGVGQVGQKKWTKNQQRWVHLSRFKRSIRFKT